LVLFQERNDKMQATKVSCIEQGLKSESSTYSMPP